MNLREQANAVFKEFRRWPLWVQGVTALALLTGGISFAAWSNTGGAPVERAESVAPKAPSPSPDDTAEREECEAGGGKWFSSSRLCQQQSSSADPEDDFDSEDDFEIPPGVISAKDVADLMLATGTDLVEFCANYYLLGNHDLALAAFESGMGPTESGMPTGEEVFDELLSRC